MIAATTGTGQFANRCEYRLIQEGHDVDVVADGPTIATEEAFEILVGITGFDCFGGSLCLGLQPALPRSPRRSDRRRHRGRDRRNSGGLYGFWCG